MIVKDQRKFMDTSIHLTKGWNMRSTLQKNFKKANVQTIRDYLI